MNVGVRMPSPVRSRRPVTRTLVAPICAHPARWRRGGAGGHRHRGVPGQGDPADRHLGAAARRGPGVAARADPGAAVPGRRRPAWGGCAMSAGFAGQAVGSELVAGTWTVVPAESTAAFRVRDKLVGAASGTI